MSKYGIKKRDIRSIYKDHVTSSALETCEGANSDFYKRGTYTLSICESLQQFIRTEISNMTPTMVEYCTPSLEVSLFEHFSATPEQKESLPVKQMEITKPKRPMWISFYSWTSSSKSSNELGKQQ